MPRTVSAPGYVDVTVTQPAAPTPHAPSAPGYVDVTVTQPSPPATRGPSAPGYVDVTVTQPQRRSWFMWASGVRHALVERRPGVTALAAGAVPLGATSYEIPSTAVIHVATTGDDSWPGTLAQPKRTIIAASNAVRSQGTASQPATVVIRGGTYHEGGYQPGNGYHLRWQAYPGEVVWLDGSTPVTGWTAVGDGTWTASYAAPAIPSLGTDVMEGDSSAILPDMLWIDGTQLYQVADGGAPGASQFSVDRSANTVRIGVNPSGKEVRVSDAVYLLFSGSRIDLLGLGIRRYRCAGSPSLHTGIFYAGTSADTLIENCHIVQMGRNSIFMGKDRATIRRCAFDNTNQNAILIAGSTTVLAEDVAVEQCKILRSNRGMWKNQPTSGAIKITRARRPVVRHNVIKDADRGGLIWYDVSCLEPITYGNYLDGQSAVSVAPSGICYEESDGGYPPKIGLCVGNTIVNCKGGIVICAGGRVVVGWNEIQATGSSAQGICLLQDRDSALAGSEAPPVDEFTRWTFGVSIYSSWIKPQSAGWQLLAYDSQNQIASTGRPRALALYGSNQLAGGEMLGAPWSAPYVAGNCFAPATGSSSSGSIMATIGRKDGVRTNVNTPSDLAALNGSGTYLVPSGGIGSNHQGTAPTHSAAYPMPAVVADLLGLPVGYMYVGNPIPQPVEV